MEKVFIHLLPTFNSLFKFIKNERTLIEVNSTECLSSTIDLEVSDLNDFEINVYPTANNSQKLFSYSSSFKFIDSQLISENNYVTVYTLPENHFIIKFSPFFVKKEEIYGDKIEFVGLEIKKLSFLNDLAGRAKVDILNVNNNKISLQNEYFVYTNEKQELETHPDLILLAFFEAYQAKDFNTCFSYLSRSYRENLNKEGLKDFFGDFDTCLLINYYAYPAILLLYKSHSTVFSANIQEDKIIDIYELN